MKFPSLIIKLGILSSLYFLTARLGLSIAAVSRFATAVWPPTGIALAALLLFGLRLWPGVIIGAFAANLSLGAPPLAALGVAIGNTLEAICGAVLLLSLKDFHKSLDRIKDVSSFIFLAAGISTLVSPTIGISSLKLANQISRSEIPYAWTTWWLGDLIGDLVIAPVLLVCLARPNLNWNPRRTLEAVSLIISVTLINLLIFVNIRSARDPLWKPYFSFPLLFLASARFDQSGATLMTLLTSMISILATIKGYGPYSADLLDVNLIHLQAFMGTLAVTGLYVAATNMERKRAISALQRAIRTKEDLVAIVSHDLKNPLSAIQLNAQLISLKLREVHTVIDTQPLTTIQKLVSRMNNLIYDLLDLAKMEAGRLSIDQKSIEIGGLLKSALEMLQPIALEKSIQLTIESSSTAGLFISCDPERILQVFSNLIGNAVQHSPKRGTVLLKVTSSKNQVTFLVQDSGKGIPEQELSHIFERYWQSNTTHRTSAGMGLYITKGIIEAHGGKIWVDSQPGKGSKFFFTLVKAERTGHAA